MKKTRILAVVVCVLAVANIASADTIQGIDIDFVTIGNPGNGTDPATGNSYGAVGYNYSISKYEVTNAQWNAFTAAAGAPTGNPSVAYVQTAHWTGAQQPTNDVSWWETMQFCNFLTSGDKSKGVYQFSGNNANPGNFLGIDRSTAKATYGIIYFLPTRNEWYKAAYYKPDDSGYSLYVNGTNTAPLTSESCYGQSDPYTGPWDVGTGTQEQNGTFDMMGNVLEWDETLMASYAGVHGGSYLNNVDDLASSWIVFDSPALEKLDLGFRVAFVPEPASAFLMICGVGLLRLQNRKR
jgi:formylglycine-generating enzyme required for sulfatase activity